MTSRKISPELAAQLVRQESAQRQQLVDLVRLKQLTILGAMGFDDLGEAIAHGEANTGRKAA